MRIVSEKEDVCKFLGRDSNSQTRYRMLSPNSEVPLSNLVTVYQKNTLSANLRYLHFIDNMKVIVGIKGLGTRNTEFWSSWLRCPLIYLTTGYRSTTTLPSNPFSISSMRYGTISHDGCLVYSSVSFDSVGLQNWKTKFNSWLNSNLFNWRSSVQMYLHRKVSLDSFKRLPNPGLLLIFCFFNKIGKCAKWKLSILPAWVVTNIWN